MKPDAELLSRLVFMAGVVSKERKHLQCTDERLFAKPFTQAIAAGLAEDEELSERVEAFVGRFGRLQDTLGDKLLPLYLLALGEKPAAAIDNLDRAERLGLIDSAEAWLAIRKLRNQMIHEYIDDPAILSSALNSGHDFVPTLVGIADRFLAEMRRRGWV